MVQVWAWCAHFVSYCCTPIIIAVCTGQVCTANPAASVIIVIAPGTYAVVSFNFGQVVIIIVVTNGSIYFIVIVNRLINNRWRRWRSWNINPMSRDIDTEMDGYLCVGLSNK
jgi:hypothetical protein